MDLADDISYSVHDVEDAIVAGHFQLRWMDNPDHRARVVGYAKQWYLPHNDPAAIDAALARLEATDVWVREADGSRKAMAALKDMTSQLIGRFCQSALEATRTVYGPENLTRYNAELIVPDETVMEIAVMKGLATTFVMTTEHRQPIYERQREVLHALVTALSATGDRHLEPMFAADWLDAGGRRRAAACRHRPGRVADGRLGAGHVRASRGQPAVAVVRATMAGPSASYPGTRMALWPA